MIEVKDEVLDGEAKYRIRDKDGNIVLDDFTMEQITTLLQIGTDINKQLFDSIHDHLIFNSKYHLLKGLTESDYITPALTSDNRQGHTVSWDYYATITYAPEDLYNMFGGDRSKYIRVTYDNDGFYHTTLTLPKPVKITEVGGWSSSASGVSANLRLRVRVLAKLNSSDEFEEILPLCSQSFEDSEKISTTKAYRYVKFEFTSISGYTANIRNGLYVKGQEIEAINFTEEIEQNLNETLTKGQIIHVETKSDYKMCTNSTYKVKTSESQSVKIPTNLVAGQRYRLVYNGTEFEHENIYKDVQLTNAIVALGGSV